MALTNYSDLVSAIGDWVVRTDVATRSADFITLLEARLNRELRLREMLDQETGSVSGSSLAIPSDFIEVHRFLLDSDTDIPLEYRPVEELDTTLQGQDSGVPKFFTVFGGNFRFYPPPDGTYTYTLDYYATIPALTSTNTTNWLLTKAPDLYLFGALCEAEAFLQADPRVALWKSRFEEALHSLNASERRSKRTNAPRRQRVVI